MQAVQHPDFARRVELELQEKRKSEPGATKTRQLVLLKDTIKEVSRRLEKEHRGHDLAITLEDRLGITMKYLRTAERGHLGEISLCLERYRICGSMSLTLTRSKGI